MSIVSMLSMLSMMIIVSIRNGKVEFRFDTGSGAAVLRSKEEVSIMKIVKIIKTMMKNMNIMKIMKIMKMVHRSRLVVGTKCDFRGS